MISCVDLASSMTTVTLSPGLCGSSMPVHGSAVNPAHLHVGSLSQARNIVELRLQLVGGAKQILLAPDDEDPGSQNRQRHNDECSQPRHSRHKSPYDCFRNSFTNPMSLC